MRATKKSVYRKDNGLEVYFSHGDLVSISDSMMADHDQLHTLSPHQLLELAEKLNRVDEDFALNFWDMVTT